MSELLVSDIFSRLAFGELSNLTLVEKNKPGTIKEIYHQTILIHLNKAMRDLFTRFMLSQKEIKLDVSEGKTHYFVRYEFAKSNEESTQTDKYIDDTDCENFKGDIVKILSVFDGLGRELFLNRLDEPLSVFTPQFDCIQITPENYTTRDFYIIFQSLHPELTLVPDSVINIPPSLEDPLLSLIAAKIYGAMNGNANDARALQYMQQYELALEGNEIKDMGSMSEAVTNQRLESAGFL